MSNENPDVVYDPIDGEATHIEYIGKNVITATIETEDGKYEATFEFANAIKTEDYE